MQKLKSFDENMKLLRQAINKAEELADVLYFAEISANVLHELQALPDCNDCMRQGCEYKPRAGEHTRINCPLHKKSAV